MARRGSHGEFLPSRKEIDRMKAQIRAENEAATRDKERAAIRELVADGEDDVCPMDQETP